ncbi:MAG: hypothetical protein BWX88_05352 [Planctomycetes bacterium ADurb.Bin126]|nr:MAG: hypothetical protein BWX88_05352 [Planctomycetes bacterium ADurb.Bin126]
MKKAARNSKNAAIASFSWGKRRCSSAMTAFRSAVNVSSIPSGPTVRYNSSITIRSSWSSTSSPSNTARNGPGFSAVPRPLNWCRATSNSKRPRQKLVAQPPGTECRSSSNVATPAFARVAAAVRPPLPAPTTMTSYLDMTRSLSIGFIRPTRPTRPTGPTRPTPRRTAHGRRRTEHGTRRSAHGLSHSRSSTSPSKSSASRIRMSRIQPVKRIHQTTSPVKTGGTRVRKALFSVLPGRPATIAKSGTASGAVQAAMHPYRSSRAPEAVSFLLRCVAIR